MMENRPPLTSPDGSSNGNPPERCPRPLYSRETTQEHQEIPQEDQNEDLINIKVEDEEDLYMEGDESCMEEEIPPEISTDPGEPERDVKGEEKEEEHVVFKKEEVPVVISTGALRNRNTTEGCPRPLCSQASTQDDHKIPQDDQGENLIKVEVKAEAEQLYVGGDELFKGEEIHPEIGIGA
ncbi:unnamed protein product [Staurois parvus]|uniref:Uncharacterized protein n=1 Tax=Staurois parvus TaxID=386267 RepID=A0ABN9DLT0_9NEOB|nr:unnamed protein product [Staurois parvus]